LAKPLSSQKSIESRKRSPVPRAVALFFLKALILFVVWKVLYGAFLLPGRILDEPLTQSVGAATTGALNLFSAGNAYTMRKVKDTIYVEGGIISGNVAEVYRNGERTLRIADACNGLEMMVLYAGFLICFPAPLKRKGIFIAGGLILIYLLNVIRCAILIGIYIHYNSMLDVSHHFVFTFIVYLFIFLLWYFFTKNLTLNGRSA
jgi:exosortase family protein XrtF